MQETEHSDWEWEFVTKFDRRLGNHQGWTQIAKLNLELDASPTKSREKWLIKIETQTAKGRMMVGYAKKEGASVSRASEEFESEVQISHCSGEGPLRLFFCLEEDAPLGVTIEGKVFKMMKRKRGRSKKQTLKAST